MVAPRRGLKQHARVQPRSRGFCLLQTLAERAGTHIIADSAKREGPRAPLCSRVGENLRRRVFLKWTSLDSRLIPSRLFLSFFFLSPAPPFPPFFQKKTKHTTHRPRPASARPAAAPGPSPAPARGGATRPPTRRAAAAAEAHAAPPATTAAAAGGRCRWRGGCTSRGAPVPTTGDENFVFFALFFFFFEK